MTQKQREQHECTVRRSTIIYCSPVHRASRRSAFIHGHDTRHDSVLRNVFHYSYTRYCRVLSKTKQRRLPTILIFCEAVQGGKQMPPASSARQSVFYSCLPSGTCEWNGPQVLNHLGGFRSPRNSGISWTCTVVVLLRRERGRNTTPQ